MYFGKSVNKCLKLDEILADSGKFVKVAAIVLFEQQIAYHWVELREQLVCVRELYHCVLHEVVIENNFLETLNTILYAQKLKDSELKALSHEHKWLAVYLLDVLGSRQEEVIG